MTDAYEYSKNSKMTYLPLFTRRTSIMMTAITRSICIKLPITGKPINPISQSIISTTAIDSSIRENVIRVKMRGTRKLYEFFSRSSWASSVETFRHIPKSRMIPRATIQ